MGAGRQAGQLDPHEVRRGGRPGAPGRRQRSSPASPEPRQAPRGGAPVRRVGWPPFVGMGVAQTSAWSQAWGARPASPHATATAADARSGPSRASPASVSSGPQARVERQPTQASTSTPTPTPTTAAPPPPRIGTCSDRPDRSVEDRLPSGRPSPEPRPPGTPCRTYRRPCSTRRHWPPGWIPMLRFQVLHAQDARINGVAGATYTAGAYVASFRATPDRLHIP